MAPPNAHVIRQLQQLIYYHLDNHLLRNALFFAGRLHAYDPKSAESAYLLALCHFRLGQLKSAYDSSKHKWTHIGCSYVFAQACLGLGKYLEGTNALDKSKGHWVRMSSWSESLGSEASADKADAIRQISIQRTGGNIYLTQLRCIVYKESSGRRIVTLPRLSRATLKRSNSTPSCGTRSPLFAILVRSSTSGLRRCLLIFLGVNVRIPNIFQMTPEMKRAISSTNSDESTLETLDESPPSNTLSQPQTTNSLNVNPPPSNNDPFTISKNRVNGDVRPNLGIFDKLNIGKASVTPITGGDLDILAFDTPTGADPSFKSEIYLGREVPSQQHTNAHEIEPPLAPVRKARIGQGLGTEISIDGPPKMRSNTISTRSRSKADSDEASLGRPPSRTNGIGERKRTISGQTASSASTVTTSHPPANVNDPMGGQGRGTRFLRSVTRLGTVATKEEMELKKKAKATGTKGRSANPGNVGRVVSGNRIHGDSMGIDSKEQRRPSQASSLETRSKPASSEGTKEKEALAWLFDLCTKLACGYFAQSHYRGQEAIQIYNTITITQRDTPWVLSQIARAYFWGGQNADAEKIYARLRILSPSRVEDMELYSTCLWHLGKETDLAFLAHEVLDVDRYSPQAWCVMGNSFAVQKDHDQAIKCFKRAVQLDPNFAYGYTLQGHEFIENEENDKALSAFRSAVALDNRQFNAWYGLGKVFEKQGKYEFAEQHFRTAAGINAFNALLLTCVGGVLEKLKNPKAALVQYTKACDLTPSIPLARLKRARVLASLRQPQAALEELTLLKVIAPEEANVFFLLGQVYKMLRQKSEAIRSWTIAQNLDPKVCCPLHPLTG
ncbi:MAG: hypothetical protein Q9182_004165 [Xanthomendoza sp. 2 TL-2023]